MFPPKKILFPVDFSENCIAAARMVETFAGHFQSEITLLHAREPATYNELMPDMQEIRRRLDNFLAPEMKYFDLKRVLVRGNAAAAIIEQSARDGSDLIMLPTHGFGHFRRFLIGSVAAKVLHDARCPVWTSVHIERIPQLEEIKFRNVLCAVDFGRQTCAALRYAAQFARHFEANLTVLHVATGAAASEMDMDTAESSLEELLRDQQLHADIQIIDDEVPPAVRKMAEALRADLVVIGRSTDDGMLGRLRTNAYSIIRQSPCPVISV